MITIDSDPMFNPVYIGASILNELSSSDFTEVEVDKLYLSVKNRIDISYEVFAFSLDWLFIAGAVDFNDKGLIVYGIFQPSCPTNCF